MRVAAAGADGSAEAGQESSRQDVLLPYLQRYYLHTAPEDIVGRDPIDVFGAASSHYRLAEDRPQGKANVRVHTPTVEENGWTCSHSVVEVVTDDMPFLVDSVTNELSRQGRGIHVVIHPQVIVRRDVTGKLVEVLTDGTGRDSGKGGRNTQADLPHDALVESWIHVEIDRETDRADLKQIQSDLLRVLSDVRETVEDWEKMRDAALRIADDLPGEPLDDLADDEVNEARELLRWLAADHFTFLGYREYELRDTDSLAAVPGTGLGILRSDPHHTEDEAHPVSPSFDRLPADARAKAREHKLLVLTKANSRATVHRPSYLDYVGVKKFDAEGNVIGERRFLGLFSSAAYTESVRRVPVIRRKVAEVLEGAGFTPNSHDGRDLLQILETYPRDELFQTPVDQLRSVVTSVLYLQERRRPAPLPAPGRVRPLLLRDRLPAARPLHHRGAAAADRHPQGGTERHQRRLHRLEHRVDPLPAALRRPCRARQRAAQPHRRRDRAHRGPSRRGRPLLGRRLPGSAERRARRGARRRTAAQVRALVPRGLQGRPLRARGRGRPGPPRSPQGERAGLLAQPLRAGRRRPGERRFKIYRTGEQVSLSAVLPALQRLGVEVVDERPYELRCADRTHAWIYDFGLRMPQATANGGYLADGARERFQDAFAAVWTGEAENDGFNALVLSAGLDWRQAMVLRAYAKYLRQAGSTFSQDYMESTLQNNVHTTRLLVSLFEARMSPGRQSAGTELTDGLLEELDGALDQVASSTRTASCAPSSPSSRPPCAPTSSSTRTTASRTRTSR